MKQVLRMVEEEACFRRTDSKKKRYLADEGGEGM